jgi:hypothetical protein
MTVAPPVLSPSNILPLLLSPHAFILASKKLGVLFNHIIIPFFVTLKKRGILKMRELKLRKVGEILY